MFCSECGAVLEDGAKFCTNCGAQAPAASPETPAGLPETETPVQPAAPAAPADDRLQPEPAWQGGDPTPPQKRGKTGLIVGVVAAVLVVAVCIGGFVWPGFFRKRGGADALTRSVSPAEYYQAVETENIEALVGHLGTVYRDLLLRGTAADGLGAAGSVRIEPGDKVRGLLLDAVGEQLSTLNPGDDLSWLKSLSVIYDFSRQAELFGLNLGLQLNDTDLIHISAAADDGVLSISVPELSDRAIAVPADELASGSPGSAGSISSGAAKTLDPVLKALPDAETAENLLKRYLTEAVRLVEAVETSDETLTVQDVSADYTVLTARIDADTAIRIAAQLGPELREDPEIRRIILDVAAAAGQQGEVEYQAFTDRIDALLNDPDGIREKMADGLTVTLYLDKSGKEHGRVVDAGRTRVEALMPELDNAFGLSVRVVCDGAECLSLSGSGKRSGDLLTGELELLVKDEYYGVIGLNGFDIEKAKDGYASGGLTLKPTASFWKLAAEKAADILEDFRLPSSAMLLLETLDFRFDLDCAQDKSDITLTVTNGSETLLTVAAGGAATAAKTVSPAAGVEISDWMEDLTREKLETVLASLREAGVPSAYTDLLSYFLYFMF